MPEHPTRYSDRRIVADLEDRAEARGGGDERLSLEEYARLCISRERLLLRASRALAAMDTTTPGPGTVYEVRVHPDPDPEQSMLDDRPHPHPIPSRRWHEQRKALEQKQRRGKRRIRG